MFNIKSISLATSLVVSFIVAFFPVWKNLVHAWSTIDDYSHGFIIIPVCGYIIFQKRQQLTRVKVNPSGWGLVFVMFSLLLYLFSYFAEIVTLSSLSMILLFSGIIIYLYGYSMAKEFLFPLFLLLFMIPIPSQIYSSLTIPLQLFVSKVSVFIAFHLGIPLFREGNVIHIPDQTLQVVQSCSGLRSMTALLTICAIFGYLTLKSNLLRTLLFIAGIPTAIIVNIIRVLLIVSAFYYFSIDLTTLGIHTLLGIFIFLLALIIIAGINGVITIWDRDPKHES